MPLNVAMEELDAWIVCNESDHRVALSIDSNDVTSHGNIREVTTVASVNTFARRWPFAHLELVSMEMEGVDCRVSIVHDNLDDLAFLYYEWVDRAIYRRIRVGSSCADCCVERWDFLWNVRYVVEE
jgi:hypothetical protein